MIQFQSLLQSLILTLWHAVYGLMSSAPRIRKENTGKKKAIYMISFELTYVFYGKKGEMNTTSDRVGVSGIFL